MNINVDYFFSLSTTVKTQFYSLKSKGKAFALALVLTMIISTGGGLSIHAQAAEPDFLTKQYPYSIAIGSDTVEDNGATRVFKDVQYRMDFDGNELVYHIGEMRFDSFAMLDDKTIQAEKAQIKDVSFSVNGDVVMKMPTSSYTNIETIIPVAQNGASSVASFLLQLAASDFSTNFTYSEIPEFWINVELKNEMNLEYKLSNIILENQNDGYTQRTTIDVYSIHYALTDPDTSNEIMSQEVVYNGYEIIGFNWADTIQALKYIVDVNLQNIPQVGDTIERIPLFDSFKVDSVDNVQSGIEELPDFLIKYTQNNMTAGKTYFNPYLVAAIFKDAYRLFEKYDFDDHTSEPDLQEIAEIAKRYTNYNYLTNFMEFNDYSVGLTEATIVAEDEEVVFNFSIDSTQFDKGTLGTIDNVVVSGVLADVTSPEFVADFEMGEFSFGGVDMRPLLMTIGYALSKADQFDIGESEETRTQLIQDIVNKFVPLGHPDFFIQMSDITATFADETLYLSEMTWSEKDFIGFVPTGLSLNVDGLSVPSSLLVNYGDPEVSLVVQGLGIQDFVVSTNLELSYENADGTALFDGTLSMEEGFELKHSLKIGGLPVNLKSSGTQAKDSEVLLENPELFLFDRTSLSLRNDGLVEKALDVIQAFTGQSPDQSKQMAAGTVMAFMGGINSTGFYTPLINALNSFINNTKYFSIEVELKENLKNTPLFELIERIEGASSPDIIEDMFTYNVVGE